MKTQQRLYMIGAAKSGTTKLADLLNQHPDICLSSPKEPNFFTKRIFEQQSVDWYESLFENPSAKFLLDASTSYTAGWNKSSSDIAKRIVEVAPDATFIYIVRDPVQRAWSSYWHSKRSGAESRRPEVVLGSTESHHIQASLYNNRIEDYLAYFPTENFHVIYFEEFTKAPEQFAHRLFSILGLPTIELSESAAEKTNSSFQWFGPFSILRRVPLSKLRMLNNLIKSVLPRGFHDWLKRVVSKPIPKISDRIAKMIDQQVGDNMKDFNARFHSLRVKPVKSKDQI